VRLHRVQRVRCNDPKPQRGEAPSQIRARPRLSSPALVCMRVLPHRTCRVMTRNSDVVSSTGHNPAANGDPFGVRRRTPTHTLKSALVWGTKRARIMSGRLGQPLAAASISAFVVFAGGAGLTYVTHLVTARIVGPDSYGVYAYVLAWVTLLAYLSTLGFHVSLLRFLPAYRAKQDWPRARGIIQYSQRGAAGTSIAIVLIGILVILALHGSIRPELANTFLVGLAAVPFIALHLIGAAAVRAFGGVVTALAPERIVRDSLSVALIAAVFWSNLFHPDAPLAMVAMLASSVVTLALVQIFLRRLRPEALQHEKAAYAAEDWFRPTLPLTIIMIADNLMSRSGVISLGLIGNTRDAGIFFVAFNIALLTALPRMAVATVFAPTVSELFARGDQAGLQAVAAKAACLSLLGTACAAVPLLLIIHPLLAWFGYEFVAGAPVVVILVLGQLFAAACGPQQHLITMTGHERTGAAILVACALSNFIACMLTIGSFGMTGAAFAMTGTLVAWNIAMAIFIYRRLHIVPGLIAALLKVLGDNGSCWNARR
jgi:O-antigen/teichoic acid export membrane protein